MGKAKKKKKPPKKPAPKGAPEKEDEGFRGIVRIGGKDMKGHLPLKRSLLRVTGISHSTSPAVSGILQSELGLKPSMRVGDLKDDQIEKIDNILNNLHAHRIPKFLLNRRMDFETGEHRHVIMNDFLFALSQDIDREKKLYSWRGYRHAYGQKVRGQRTRNTGRKGMAVGVIRKAVAAAQAGKSGVTKEKKPEAKKPEAKKTEAKK